MTTFTYSNPPETITIEANGDITITDGATSTTYSKNGSRTVTKKLPGAKPSVDQGVATPKANGDTFVTYADAGDPPGTTTVKFRKNGDVDMEVKGGKKHTKIHIDGKNGTRETTTWEDPNPEPSKPDKTEKPTSTPPPPAPPAPPAPPPPPAPPAPPAPPSPPSPPPAPPTPKKPKKKVKPPKKKPGKKGKRTPKKGKKR